MPAARSDVESLVEYVRRESPVRADELEDRLYEAMGSLSEFPERCSEATESITWGYTIRVLLVFRFRILFVVRTTEVSILRIVHGHMRSPIEPAP